MFVGVALISIALGIITYTSNSRKRIREELNAAGVAVTYTSDGYPEWLVAVFGNYLCVDGVVLYANGAIVSDDVSRLIDELPCLTNVVIVRSTLSIRAFEVIANSNNLEFLSVQNSVIENYSAARLQLANSIKFLEISNAAFDDDGLRCIGKLSNLEELHIENTEVTDSGLSYLASMQSLRQVSLAGTKVTEQGVDRLQAALPAALVDRW